MVREAAAHQGHRSRTRLIVMFGAGVVATGIAAVFGTWLYAPIIGWAIAPASPT